MRFSRANPQTVGRHALGCLINFPIETMDFLDRTASQQ